MSPKPLNWLLLSLSLKRHNLNLPFLSKILEKVVSSQLYSFLEKNYICEDFQSGFRPSHNTKTALIRVTHDLLLSSDRGCIPLLVLLDLSAAFDTIDHNILLNRLENFVGISGSALAWFKSYLSDRHQFVAVNEVVSNRSQVRYRVRQGSVLGPLLFTLYMLPLGNIIRKHGVSFHCYAYDSQLYISLRPGETNCWFVWPEGNWSPDWAWFLPRFILHSVTDGVLVPCRCRFWLG